MHKHAQLNPRPPAPRAALAAALGLMLLLPMQGASAKELDAGLVITKDNYEAIKNDTFENKTIASMVPEKLEWMIKNYDLTIKLAHSKKKAKNTS